MKSAIATVCFKYPPEYSGYGKQLKSVNDRILKEDSDIEFKLLTAYNSSIEETKDNFDVIPMGTGLGLNHKIELRVFSIRVLFWLLFNKDKYDVIHCIKAGPEAISANIASKLFNKPLLVKVAQDELSDREISSVSGLRKLHRTIRHSSLKRADNFIAISEEIKENLMDRVSKNSRIIRIPNGVETENKYKPSNSEIKEQLRSELSLPMSDVIVLFAGAINKRKGIYDLLESVRNIEVTNHFTLVLCGPILEDYNFLDNVSEINEKNSKVTVIYKGKVSNVNEYMKASDIFVLPSYSEGLPNVLLEAAASGLALIATDIGGSRDIVLDNVNGRLVELGNSRQLSNALGQIIDDKELQVRYGQESRKYAVNKFSLKHVSRAYIDLYKALSK